MTSTRHPLLIAVAAALLPILVLAGECGAQSVGPWFLGIQYGAKDASDPLFEETLFDLFYPVGGCPTLWGCSSPVMPVVVSVHGGNQNAPLSGPSDLSDMQLQLLGQGFVVAIPSFHVLDYETAESYLAATADIARLIQCLRHFHAIVNIDPARVFCEGRSAGGFHALYLGLNLDFRVPGSTDPVLHQSSRPDALVVWGAISDFSCVDLSNPVLGPFISKMIFGVPDASGLPKQVKQAASPSWWLSHPQSYGCTVTPPMCLVYNLGAQSPCGAITNVHDGTFGVLLQQSIGRLCATSGIGQAVCSESVLLDAVDVDAATVSIVAWLVERAW